MNVNIIETLKSIWNAFCYIFFSAFLGLVPVWIVMLYTCADYDKKYELHLDPFLISNSLILFGSSLAGIIAYETFFNKRFKVSKGWMFLICAIPLGILIFNIIISIRIFNLGNDGNADKISLANLQRSVAYIAIGYSFVMKSIINLHEYKKLK